MGNLPTGSRNIPLVTELDRLLLGAVWNHHHRGKDGSRLRLYDHGLFRVPIISNRNRNLDIYSTIIVGSEYLDSEKQIVL